MTSVTDYAPSDAQERHGPSPLIAAALSLVMPGLGHIYIGQARRGIVLFALVIAANTALLFSLMGVLARFWLLAISVLLLSLLWLYILRDAVVRAQRTHEYPQRRYCRWPVYVAAGIFAWLINLTPFAYAAYARATGHLGWFRVTTDSMDPTLRRNEFFLADASYYQSHPPTRGEVVVFTYSERPGEHYTRRVVAVEGDRVAVRDGRVIVNGMALMEPYVADSRPGVLQMPEIRVPLGHVFMLGDNRSIATDSETMSNGPIPVSNLIGRATDVVYSRHVFRMGRWIGTPSGQPGR